MADNLLFIKEDEASFYAKGDFSVSDIIGGGDSGGGGGGGDDTATSSLGAQFVQTTNTDVDASTAEETLTNGGLGSLVVPPNEYLEGCEEIWRAWGVYSTKDEGPGYVTVRMMFGSEVEVEFQPFTPAGGMDSEVWFCEMHLIRRTDGGTGEITGYASLNMGNGNDEPFMAIAVVAPVVVPSTVNKTAEVTAQWSVNSADNVFRCYGTKLELAADGAPASASRVSQYVQTGTGIVNNTTTESSITDIGVGSLTIGAGEFLAGGEEYIRSWGVFDTKASGPGTITIRVGFGTEIDLEFTPFNPNGGLSDMPWFFWLRLIRRSEGVNGEVSGFGMLVVGTQNEQPELYPVAIAPVVVSTASSKDVAVTVQWSVANASNNFECYGTKVDYISEPQ